MKRTEAREALHPATALALATGGLGLASIPAAADRELRRIMRSKQTIAAAWREHEPQIRAAAAARHIRPPFPKNRYFAEAIAAAVLEQRR